MSKGSPIASFYGTYPVLLISIWIACFGLGATLLYVVHSRKYKLNWFERNRLDSLACEEATIVKLCNRQRYHSGSTCSDGSLADLSSVLPRIQSDVPQDQQQKPQGETSQSVAKTVDGLSMKSVLSSVSMGATPTPDSLSAAGGETCGGSAVSPSGLDAVVLKYQPPSSAGQKARVNTMYEKLDHTKFNADMYQTKVEEDSAGDEQPENAKLHLTCSYNPQFSILCVRVNQVEGLTTQSHVMNPYLRVSLVSETKSEQTKVSQVQKNTTELQFEEEFVFNEISQDDLETNTVNVFVLNEMQKTDSTSSIIAAHCMGGVQFALDQLVNSAREQNVKPISMVLPLRSEETIATDKSKYGDIQLSMSYLQSAERLTISVLRAKGLPVANSSKAGENPDVFVKLTVTTSSGKNRSNKKKKRTGTQKNTISPVFNEAFTFHVSRSGLRSASLHLCVEHELPPPFIPLQQKEIQLAKLTLSPGHLCDFVHSASNGLQAKWFHLEPPEQR